METALIETPDIPNAILPAWEHQKQAFWTAYQKDHFALFMDMGTGKSKVTIDLINNKPYKNILIVCPLSVVGVWPREFEKHGTRPYQVIPLYDGSVEKKAERAKVSLEIAKIKNSAFVCVINYESIWRPKFKEFALDTAWDLIVLDESHRIKAPGGIASRFLALLGKRSKHRMLLTGTPMPGNPGDLYAQYRFLDPSVFGTSYFRYKAWYSTPVDMYTVAWNKNQDDLSRRMYSIAYRVTKDVLDLPEAIHESRECELSPAVMRKYRELEEEFYIQLDNGEVTTNNALTKLLRLQQIANGFVRTDDEHIVFMDDSKERVLADFIEDVTTAEKIVVFSKFTHDLEVIKRVAENAGRRYGEISGARKDLTPHATFPDEIDVMGVQIQAGGVGIDLSKARYCVYYSVGFNLGDYEQSLARVHRPGQTKNVFYLHILAKNTVDTRIYKALKQKKKIVEAILQKEV